MLSSPLRKKEPPGILQRRKGRRLSEGLDLPSPRLRRSPWLTGMGSKKGKKYLFRAEGFCKVQVSLVSLEGDMGDVLKDGVFDTVASLLHSRNNKHDKKVQSHHSKVRRLTIPKGLMRGESPCGEGERWTYSVPSRVGGVLLIMVTNTARQYCCIDPCSNEGNKSLPANSAFLSNPLVTTWQCYCRY